MKFWFNTYRALIFKMDFTYFKNDCYKRIDLEIGLLKWSITWLIYFKQYREEEYLADSFNV